MSRIFIYPQNDLSSLVSPNPYMKNFEKVLLSKHDIVNKKPNNKGILEFFLFLFKADIFFLNWIEDLAFKRFGKLQTLLLPVFLLVSKSLRKKIIWVLHNKYSHESTNIRWIKYGFELMIKKSDLILTHSYAGLEFIEEYFPQYLSKVKYIIHPMEKMLEHKQELRKKYDLFIWGTIYPYKGIIEFLEFMHRSEQFSEFNILICGYCPDPKLKSRIDTLLTKNIIHLNSFYSLEKIAEFAKQSKFVLFTYNSESILSSGSLMDSIRMGSVVIGPNKGAFKDLKAFSFINTYDRMEEIPDIIVNYMIDTNELSNDIKGFCDMNSWDLLSEKLNDITGGIL